MHNITLVPWVIKILESGFFITALPTQVAQQTKWGMAKFKLIFGPSGL